MLPSSPVSACAATRTGKTPRQTVNGTAPRRLAATTRRATPQARSINSPEGTNDKRRRSRVYLPYAGAASVRAEDVGELDAFLVQCARRSVAQVEVQRGVGNVNVLHGVGIMNFAAGLLRRVDEHAVELPPRHAEVALGRIDAVAAPTVRRTVNGTSSRAKCARFKGALWARLLCTGGGSRLVGGLSVERVQRAALNACRDRHDLTPGNAPRETALALQKKPDKKAWHFGRTFCARSSDTDVKACKPRDVITRLMLRPVSTTLRGSGRDSNITTGKPRLRM